MKISNCQYARPFGSTQEDIMNDPHYSQMHAPEQLYNIWWTGSVDVWQIGCIFYCMCNFHLPYEGATEFLTYKNIELKGYEPVDGSIHTEEVKTMVDLLLEKDPLKRPDIHGVLTHPIVVAKRQEYGL